VTAVRRTAGQILAGASCGPDSSLHYRETSGGLRHRCIAHWTDPQTDRATASSTAILGLCRDWPLEASTMLGLLLHACPYLLLAALAFVGTIVPAGAGEIVKGLAYVVLFIAAIRRPQRSDESSK